MERKIEIGPLSEQQWFVQLPVGRFKTPEEIEENRQMWEALSHIETITIVDNAHVRFLFNAEKPITDKSI